MFWHKLLLVGLVRGAIAAKALEPAATGLNLGYMTQAFVHGVLAVLLSAWNWSATTITPDSNLPALRAFILTDHQGKHSLNYVLYSSDPQNCFGAALS
jgi:hypothetical protein